MDKAFLMRNRRRDRVKSARRPKMKHAVDMLPKTLVFVRT